MTQSLPMESSQAISPSNEEAQDIVAWLISQAHISSCKMDGNHYWHVSVHGKGRTMLDVIRTKVAEAKVWMEEAKASS